MRVLMSVASRLVPALSLLLFAGCGTVPVVPDNEVVGSWSQSQALSVAVGGSATVTLTFNSTNGETATKFAVTGALPADWQSLNGSVSCPQVSSNSGSCLLALRYTPTTLTRNVLVIDYQYVDSEGYSRTGEAKLAYRSTSHDNVVSAVTPTGTVLGVIGSSQSVSVQFTTDDGQPATNFQVVTPFNGLPPGWASSVSSFSCATVSTGNGCQLQLTYAPTALGGGRLVIAYSYLDDSGTPQTGALGINYSAVNDNNVIATPSPAGQITGVVGGRNVAVAIGFTTDDGNPATNLQISSGLGTLPAGWSGPPTFTCATIATGNGCTLNLSYSPPAPGSGTVLLSYQYTSLGGASKSGTILISYVATTDDNVLATASPAGQINSIVGGSGVPVTVTFTTDDGNLASNLTITSNLASLPAGWSIPGAANPPSFSCPTLATGNSCQLSLLFAPTVVENGTLQLAFSYNSNDGTAKTGTVSLPYSSSAHDTVVATVFPAGQVTAEVNMGTQLTTVTFTSDDANPVTNLMITSGLATLPTDWTGPASFNCASASTGTGCQLTLQFKPTSISDNGTIALGYSYLDNAGTAQTGTVSISYAAVPIYIYVAEQAGNILRCAVSATDGSVSGCVVVQSGFMAPYGLTFNGNVLYVADANAGTVSLCPVNLDGTLGSCSVATAAGANPYTQPFSMAIHGGELYTVDGNGGTPIIGCTINPDATLGNCFTTGWSAPSLYNVAQGIAIATASSGISYAYIVDYEGGNLTTCEIDPAGTDLENCTQGPLGGTPAGLGAYQGNLYVGVGINNDAIERCPIAADGSVDVTQCVSTAAQANFAQPVGFAFNNGYAYLSGYGGSTAVGGVFVCPITAGTGNLDTCTLSLDPLTEYQPLFGIAAH